MSGLDGWSAENQTATHALLAEHHDISSLEHEELGCTDLVKYEFKVTDKESFKEGFHRIPPPMVDDICSHVKKILEADTIWPSQNMWCNVVELVCKKDGGPCFCFNFCKLNARTKKDSSTLPQIQEAIESLVNTGYFSCLDFKVGFWEMMMDGAIHHFYCGEHRTL